MIIALLVIFFALLLCGPIILTWEIEESPTPEELSARLRASRKELEEKRREVEKLEAQQQAIGVNREPPLMTPLDRENGK